MISEKLVKIQTERLPVKEQLLIVSTLKKRIG